MTNVNSTIAVKLTNVSKTFKLDDKNFRKNLSIIGLFKFLFSKSEKRTIKAINNINFEIKKGETIGVIGKNGSGKSTLIKTMSGAFFPDLGGKVDKTGRSILMTLKVGMNAELTARQNIYINGSALGLRVKEIDKLYDKIIEFAELKEYEHTLTRNFSNGMLAKLAFSIAINANAEIMFLDEVFAVGDLSFKKKAIDAIERNWLEGRTVILVTHSLPLVSRYCDRAIYLKEGQIAFSGDPKTAIKLYNKDSKISESDVPIKV